MLINTNYLIMDKADKGSGLVTMNQNDYNGKVNDFISSNNVIKS